jgi:hypothetical protein
VRVRTLSLAVTFVLIAASTTVGGTAHAAKGQQRRTTPRRNVKKTGAPPAPVVQRRQVSQGELNSFLRSPAGKAKMKVYKQQAFDAPRLVAHPKGERPLGSLRQLHHVYKSSGRLIKIFSYASSVVTGAMGAFLGGTIGLWTGGMPTGPEMLQNPGTHPAVHFLTQGHVVIGALIGAGAAIATGTLVAAGFKRSARKVDQQAENEAVLRILGELETGTESRPPQPHPGFASSGSAGGGQGGDNSLLNDFFGGPGGLFGPQTSASNQAAMRDGISDVGPSGFDSFGSPGGPP